MKDPFDLFIEDSVYAVNDDYYKLMYKTKFTFFDYLNKGKSFEDFQKANDKIWSKFDYSFMKQRIKELDEMIKQRDLKGNKIINPNAEFKEVYDLVSISKYKSVEDKFKKVIEDYYKVKLKTIKKEYINKKAYLTKGVDTYDEVQQTIPYYNKDGSIHSYHNIASYNSMLYNVSLNHAGWNRTSYDAKLLGVNIEYLPAHTFACPLCQEWQGKLYSNDGTSGIIDGRPYQPKENAIAGGVGHPNCRHQWTLYWSEDQLQKNDYNSEEWVEKYKAKQKNRAIERKISTIKNDRKIYRKIGNYEEVDKANQKINALKSKLVNIG